MSVKEMILKEKDFLVDFRRDLHQHPELSMEEYETTKKVASELDKLGVPYRLTEPTGLIATIKGNKEGKTVLLRADMDALSVQELNEGLSYTSQTDGKMHACGHDSHTAMLLTAVKVLVQLKEELNGTVQLVFQPGEEVAKGAKVMIKQGALEGVDNVFGLHIWSQLPSGVVACDPGPSFAAADVLKIHFEGKGGHAAMPQQSVDAAIMASQFVANAQAIISREIDPLMPAVLTIGKMEVGQRFNVIAQDAVLEGTIRTFHKEARDTVEEKLRCYANQIAAMYGGKVTIDYERITEVVDNEKQSAELVKQITREAFGEEAIANPAPTMGGEDFGFFMTDTPGAFALVGSGDPEKDTCWPHHHGRFNIDEDAMLVGAELYVQYAMKYLGQ